MLPFGAMRGTVLTFAFLVSLSTQTVQQTRLDNDSLTGSETRSSDPPCKCVPYYNCDTDNIVITNGEGNIDIRQSGFDDANEESMCDNYLELCCRLPETEVKTRNCGFRRTRNLHPLIPRLDKEKADRGEFPWMVTIFRTKVLEGNNETKETKVYQCQGTLIHERVVLTAAQCVQSLRSEPLSIRAGQSDTMTTQEESSYQERDVKKILVHPRFKPTNLRNNFALLVLETSVSINANVDIACLPDHRDVIDEDKCLVIGWDKFLVPEDVFFQRSQSNDLKRRIEPYISTANCTKILNKTFLGQHYKLHKSFVCAGGTASTNFCSREIGAPLACPLKSEPNQYVQIGISSWCISFGNVPVPSVFARVLHARKWINTAMAKARIGSSANQARNLQID